jgi:hypothetical protein
MKSKLFKNLYNLFIFSLLILFSPGLARIFPADRAELTSRIHENREFQCRLILSLSEYTIFILTEMKNSENLTPALGLTWEWFTCGPVMFHGLFREAAHPLEYTPRSGVFMEKTAIQLKTSFNPGPDRYLVVKPLPGYITLFYKTPLLVPGPYQDNKVLRYCGIHGSYSFGDIYTTELLISCAEPGVKEPGTEWFYPVNQYPGGMIYHLSMKQKLFTKYITASLSGSISRGDTIFPGFFLHHSITGKTDWGSLSLILGYCSPDYITPGGRYTRGMFRAGAALQASFVSWLSPDVWYYLDIGHPVPGSRNFLPTTHKGEGTLSGVCSLTKANLLRYIIKEEFNISYDEQGEKETTCKTGFHLGYTNPTLKADTHFTIHSEKNEGMTYEWETGITWKKGYHSLLFSHTLWKQEEFAWEGKLEYRLEKKTFKMWISISNKKEVEFSDEGVSSLKNEVFRYFSFSAGFKVIHT